MNDDTSYNACLLLYRYVTDKTERLQYGLRLRQEMLENIRNGIEPEGYRAEWIKETVKSVFKLLGEKAMTFNLSFPRDLISNHDLVDVINTAAFKLQESSKKK